MTTAPAPTATTAMTFFAAIGDKARRAQCQETIAGVETRQGKAPRGAGAPEVGDGRPGRLGKPGVRGAAATFCCPPRDPGRRHGGSASKALDEAARVCSEAHLDDLAVELDLDSKSGELWGRAITPRRCNSPVRRSPGLSPGVERPHLAPPSSCLGRQRRAVSPTKLVRQ